MKIGILTFHSQQNYGGVLQCWALKTALERMGHEVKVLDRWFDSKNRTLLGTRVSPSLREWIMVILRTMTGQGGASSIRRSCQFEQFIRGHFNLTDYHFCIWKDAPRELGVNLIVVGSDQVWHGGDWGAPSVYLLEDAPNVPAIAYAASFGMGEIPNTLTDCYRQGFSRFSSISVREKEGKKLVESLGGNAAVVVDPTLLLSPESWMELVGPLVKSRRRKLLVYFIGEEAIESLLPLLELFADQHGYEVDVFTDGYGQQFRCNPLWIIRYITLRAWSRVRIRDGMGPIEFLQAIAAADYVLTNSFHAVIFSSIFSRQVQVVAPKSDGRKNMFARIEEFVSKCVSGPVIIQNVQKGLESIGDGVTVAFNQKEIMQMRKTSWNWLMSAIKQI